jgi:branched-chain amino acid transport system substrate-binding protein
MRKKVLAISLMVVLTVGLFLVTSTKTEPKPILIAVPTALKSDYGYDAMHAAELAVAEINAKGGVLIGGEKRPVKIVTADTRDMDPTTPIHDALLAVEKVILEQKPDAILIGFGRSEALMAGMDLVAKYKIPYVGSYAQTHMFQKQFATDPGKYKYLFRVCTDATIVPKTLTDSLDILKNQYGLSKIFFMQQDTLLSKGFLGVLRAHTQKTGWEELGYEVIASDSTDFSAVLTKAKERKAQVICTMWDVAQGATIFVKQWAAMKVPSLILGHIVGVSSPRAVDIIGSDIDYCIQTEGSLGSSIPLKKVPKARELVERFVRKYGLPRSQWITGSAYDGAYVLTGAMERAGSLEPDKIIAELEKTDYKGVTGRIRFDKTHQAIFGDNPEETAVCFSYQWQKGKMVPIYPLSIAEGKVLLPPWMK